MMIENYTAFCLTTMSGEDGGSQVIAKNICGVWIKRDDKDFLRMDENARISVDWAEVERQHAQYLADPVGSGAHAAICALLWSARMSRDSAQ